VIVQSSGALQTVGLSSPPPGFGVAFTSLETRPYRYRDFASEQYALMYATDPNLRIPIDFLAGNVAQLGLHVFRRVSDTDRQRLPDHQLAQWLAKPNPGTTTFRLIEGLLGDLGVYKNAYWLKVRYDDDTGASAIGLLRLPPEQMWVQGGLLPTAYVWRSTSTGAELAFAPSEIVAFGGYNPLDPLMGLSHMTTLDRVIREDAAASAHREYYWRNASRHEGVIERPGNAAKWTPTQKQSFREQWQQRFAGSGNSGLVAVLEDGMQFKPVAFSPKDSEFIQGGKLRREVTAAEYNVPQPSVGILDHATFSNIREQHKQLYQDSLGPTLEMVTQEIERQLLIECTDQKNIYIEFNIAAKLAGSFEEQGAALRLAIGRPFMTPNEGRARLNLPSIKDDPTADQLAPQQGGPAQASPTQMADDTSAPVDDTSDTDPDATDEPGADETATLIAHTIAVTRRRQYAALAREPEAERSTVFFARIERWNRELAADLAPLVGVDEARRIAEYANAETYLALDRIEEVA
jgi:HK97 family phage portal protein